MIQVPSFWGKTKCEAMGYVKEKVLRKVQSQKQNLLLMKTIAATVLVYTIQCFKIPKKACNERNLALADFLWVKVRKKRRRIG